MPEKKAVKKQLVNTRLLKSYGGWIYCETCNNTVGYLCYSTYDYFRFEFDCNCGGHGSIEIGEDSACSHTADNEELIIKKGRLCCPHDLSPLFSIVEKNLKNYKYKVICKECAGSFSEK